MRSYALTSIAALLAVLVLCPWPAQATPYWSDADAAKWSVGDHPQAVDGLNAAIRERLAQTRDIDYLAQYALICSFLDTWQVSRIEDPNYGGIIEGEQLTTIIQTDNTSESIWIWSRYYELTGDNQYFGNIQASFTYSLNNPAYLEEGTSDPTAGYYRMYNCGWATRAELKYRQVYGDPTYKAYGDSCANYIRYHTLNQAGTTFQRRVNPPVLSWALGNLYFRGVMDNNAAWRDAAAQQAQDKIKVWVEATPSMLSIEEWAMSGGATMWGLLSSYFAAHPGEVAAWVPVYDEYMDTYATPAGSFTNAWNGWYALGHLKAGQILDDPYHLSVHQTLTDFLVGEDGDLDGGIPARPEENDTQDQTWISSYLGFMGLDGMLPPAADVPVPTIADLSAPRLTLGANPVRGAAALAYTLPQPGPATLEILDVAGRSVARLDATAQTAGSHSLTWLGVDAGQHPVPAGAYFAVLRTAQGHATQRIVWVR
jgi:hypothetical protein